MVEMTTGHGLASIRPGSVGRLRGWAQSLGLLWVLIVLCAFAVYLSPSFIQTGNILNVGRQVALFGIVSVGMTFVILTRGIDLSVGSIVGVVAVATALLLSSGVPIPLAVIAALGMGALFGAINGAGVVFFGMPPFIMTLGTLVMGRGIAMTIANGEPKTLGDASDAFSYLGSGFLLGIPVPIWIFVAIAAAAFVILRHTPFGRQIYAVGSNTEAARLAGINVPRVLMSVYAISGVLSALTALVFVSRLTVGEPTAGTNLELEAISIVVIGGTSLFGGEGGVIGTVIGAAIIAVMANILNLLGISPFTQQIVKGAIIIAAVMFEVYRRKRRS
ncbi:monosaccharide ABC transporter membrane protein (CUT2 family) [Mesorhizobium loti]|jgi:ribose transport system permease protein|uniref:Monosaccharide ABC transporter membrane protein (CUT2 family) n=1 Tax=Rhizobium loti TaxID=381 RepID=A0A8E2W8J2_RHILI|nr:ABC transporter permease [Mesorhizobium loti]PWJ88568.1 monosaccharide ABC transporter membrane protein (CUT2 family) [Mesorhizobium loti]